VVDLGDLLAAVGCAQSQARPVVLRRRRVHALAGHQAATTVVQFGDQRGQKLHRIELNLFGQPHSATKLERHVQPIQPVHVKPSGLRRLELRSRGRQTVIELRQTVSIFALKSIAWSAQYRASHTWPSPLPSTYCRTTSTEWRCEIAESRLPCNRLTFTIVLPVATAPALRASTTTTRFPRATGGPRSPDR
jgi:hypothetical protein